MSDLGWPFVTGKNTYIERADGIYLFVVHTNQRCLCIQWELCWRIQWE